MVTIEKQNDDFVFEVKGFHKLWALKSQITIPSENITKAYRNTEDMSAIHGLRFPGTHVPGLITAGSYIVKDGTIFCDIMDSAKSIVVELKDNHYTKLVVEVENVDAALAILQQ